ncbi:sulfurtransferase TusA family protein [Paracoccus aminophilus]|uniref:UPF0033 domain-containing protein n=1 Tax=Paracoccus aminophilus JCM 7686 TaxID=1367847 RepID=S5XQW7_PARAH|nr:sulfurtransferase TusA family protein [Paracoccus aminophilus]AGT07462.1 hypothetical protein JCM7686_0353 [Paracoccus aminophilus JCM 7686]
MTLDIDARGLLCPLPVLKLRKRLLALPQGALVRLIATDPAAVIDVPHFCREAGHSLIATEPQGNGATAYTVARGPAAAERAVKGSGEIG